MTRGSVFGGMVEQSQKWQKQGTLSSCATNLLNYNQVGNHSKGKNHVDIFERKSIKSESTGASLGSKDSDDNQQTLENTLS